MPPCVTPRNIQEVQASKLGDAQGIPFFINKNLRSFQTLRFYCFMHSCVVLGASQFLFLFFICLVCLSKLVGYTTLLLEIDTLCFHCLEHSSFHSYCFVSVLFCQHCVQPQFSCAFSLELFSYSLWICETRSLIFVDYYLCELFQISRLVLEKSRKFHAYSGIKGSLF